MTPNLNANPLAALPGGASAPRHPADTASPVLLANAPAGEPGAEPNEGGFLALLQSLNLPIAELQGVPQSLAGGPAPDLAETLASGAEASAGIPVIHAALQTPDQAPLVEVDASGNLHPAGGSLLPLAAAETPELVNPLQAGATRLPAEVHTSVPVPVPEAGIARQVSVTLTPGQQVIAAAAGPNDTPTEYLLNAATSTRTELPPPTQAQMSATPEPAQAPLSETLRELLRFQTGKGNSDLRSATLAPGATIDPLTDIGGPDGYLPDAARPLQSIDRPAAASALPTLSLARPAGMPGWDQALGQRVLWMAENGMGQAELRLDPPNLGSLNIRIAMHDEQAQVFFQAQNPAAREALEAAMPRLREMFADQGLQLGDADVSARDDGHAGEEGADGGDSGDHDVGDSQSASGRDRGSSQEGESRRVDAGAGVIDTYA